ncbi:MAG TPA: tellurite resistance TerB family protein [Candidatus Thermoplasmatota archaeon]|nr:tellurite resistance TerB family protein [Candidatus Thermoplasmatota archaeon]
MGLLDRVLRAPTAISDGRDAFAALAFCAVAADGRITEEEAQVLGAALGRMRLYEAVHRRQMGRIFETVASVVREKGAEAVVDEAAPRVPAELRVTAFAVALDLVMADHGIGEEERGLMERMRVALGVDAHEARDIERVLEIKNRG